MSHSLEAFISAVRQCWAVPSTLSCGYNLQYRRSSSAVCLLRQTLLDRTAKLWLVMKQCEEAYRIKVQISNASRRVVKDGPIRVWTPKSSMSITKTLCD